MDSVPTGFAPEDSYHPFRTGTRQDDDEPFLGSFCTASRGVFLSGERDEQPVVLPTPPPYEESVASLLEALAGECQVQDFGQAEAGRRMDCARVILPNGWSVSVNYGPSGYNDNHRHMDRLVLSGQVPWRVDLPWARYTTTAEVAIFQPNGSWFVPHEDGSSRVWGHVEVGLIQGVIDAVSQIRAEGESERCPCPACVGERVPA